MNSKLIGLDVAVLVVYIIAMVGLGLVWWRRGASTAEQFAAGGRRLPSALCGLSIFATYLSSITFLALPGKAFAADWNPFVFSLSIPLAAWISVKWFLPYYRDSGQISAYALLEDRFGAWARMFGSLFFLLFQMARVAIVLYLMALPLSIVFGWDIQWLIVATGLAVILYSASGGLLAVVWADAIQAVVLTIGALVALYLVWTQFTAGPWAVWDVATRQTPSKFSLGTWDWSVWTGSAVWLTLSFGLFENLKNFGIDQNYIQRYVAAESPRAAWQSVWLGALLYIPVSATFLLIGTSLFVAYSERPDDWREVQELASITRAGIVDGTDATSGMSEPVPIGRMGDRVFPHFIGKYVPPGIKGLLVAAILAAAMSTVSTSLHSSTTVLLSDVYLRWWRPDACDKRQLNFLRGSLLSLGIVGIGLALLLVRQTESVLDLWWAWSSQLGAGLLGLFLLARFVPHAGARQAAAGLSVAMLILGWMSLSRSELWPAAWETYASPFDPLLSIVVGSFAVVSVGGLSTMLGSGRGPAVPPATS
jgi:SSS family solute:Na+ symporter